MSLSAPSFYRMKISEFIRMSFIGRPPAARTIKAAIEAGEWAGEKIGSSYFISLLMNRPSRFALSRLLVIQAQMRY